MRGRTSAKQQLLAMRSRIAHNLAERIDGGDLAMLAAVHGCLVAVEAVDTMLRDAGAAVQATVSDAEGEPIGLTLYQESEATVMVQLPPISALPQPGQLIRAALRDCKRAEHADGHDRAGRAQQLGVAATGRPQERRYRADLLFRQCPGGDQVPGRSGSPGRARADGGEQGAGTMGSHRRIVHSASV